jgi:hypothetical protein
MIASATYCPINTIPFKGWYLARFHVVSGSIVPQPFLINGLLIALARMISVPLIVQPTILM